MCDACASAETQPDRDEFRRDCRSCVARALAATGAHIESAAKGGITQQYRGALGKLFGADKWREGHELVKVWASKIRAAKARAL